MACSEKLKTRLFAARLEPENQVEPILPCCYHLPSLDPLQRLFQSRDGL